MTAAAASAGRRRCSPSPPTTPSAAATCGPGSACCPRCPRRGSTRRERWARHNAAKHKQDGWPDRNAEYLLYQTLVGAWPIDAEPGRRLHGRRRRRKPRCTRPGPTRTPATTTRWRAFVSRDPRRPGASSPTWRRSWPSTSSSSAAGSLAGPDDAAADLPRRARPVPGHRGVGPVPGRPGQPPAGRLRPPPRLLGELAGAGPEAALARADEGGPKLWLIHRLLGHRRRHPGGLRRGSGYQPLPVRGPRAGHVVAFARTGGLAVVVPRLVAGLATTGPGPRVALPGGAWTDVLTGDRAVAGGGVSVAALLARFPVAVLGREALMHEFRVWAPGGAGSRSMVVDEVGAGGPRVMLARRQPGAATGAAAGGPRPSTTRGRAPTTPSGSTAARPGPTRARPSSPTASTARPGSSTTRRSPGPTRAGAGCRWPGRCSTSATSARSRPRAPSTARSSTSTTWSSSASTPSS